MYPTWLTKLSLQKYKYVQSVLQNFMYINYYKLLTSEEKKNTLGGFACLSYMAKLFTQLEIDPSKVT